MGTPVLVLTNRPSFEEKWCPALHSVGLKTRTVAPELLGESVRARDAVLIDAGCDVFDEDELLASVGFARALRATVAVVLPDANDRARRRVHQ